MFGYVELQDPPEGAQGHAITNMEKDIGVLKKQMKGIWDFEKHNRKHRLGLN